MKAQENFHFEAFINGISSISFDIVPHGALFDYEIS